MKDGVAAGVDVCEGVVERLGVGVSVPAAEDVTLAVAAGELVAEEVSERVAEEVCVGVDVTVAGRLQALKLSKPSATTLLGGGMATVSVCVPPAGAV